MKNRTKIIAAILGVLILAYIGLRCQQKRTIPVKVARVSRGEIENVVTAVSAGTLNPLRELPVGIQTGGRVLNILKSAGDQVSEGDVVVKLDSEELANKLKIELTNREAATARLSQIRIKLNNARTEYERIKELYEKGIFPKVKFEDAEAAYKASEEELKALDANLRQLDGSLDLLRSQIEKMDLKAPFTGMVKEINVVQGQSLLPNQPAFAVIDTSKLKVEASFDEVDFPRLHVGQRVHVKPEAFPNEVFEGTVSFVAPVIGMDKRLARIAKVEVELEGKSEHLKPGMSVGVDIIIEKIMGVLYIPSRTMFTAEGGEDGVWLVGSYRTKKVPVKIGISSWNRTEIREGLEEGDQVVVSVEDPSKAKKLKDGARIKVAGFEEESKP